MSKVNDGGPAFAAAADQYGFQMGMTLRDYFAAAALSGCLVARASLHSMEAAKSAYTIADAMLAQREKSS